ncbi:DNA repair protein rad8/SNF2 family helicase/hypothetical protein [Blumeria hordei DH14]|uniref:Helicase ATP-binding domain-containing protein n=1 Tax=Blumeria graminis f. sp. hordei (strain DH14) TaxID=546991 RepID=N1JQA3_BLUG1|nr:DNA repair protein rad8/SNF2 family helicase/hypothetical protein [Blumeria hordei DH14]
MSLIVLTDYKALHQRSTRATNIKLFQGSNQSLKSTTLKRINTIKPDTKDDSDTESDTSTHSEHSTSSDGSEMLVQEVDNSQDEDYVFDNTHEELYNSSDSKEFEIEDHDSISDPNDSESSKYCDYSSSEELNVLGKMGETLNFEHVFSAEIEPFKQAYISRNYPNLLVFRDICELARSYAANKMATTALGGLAPVPGNIDLLVTGFCCVDFSNLNNCPKTLMERGESGDTFCATVAFILKGKPKIVIFENVLAGYSCQLIKIDTKDYYIPQTRQRGYMLCVRNDILGSTETKASESRTKLIARNQMEKWVASVSSFKHPATVSCEEMLLAVADETAVPVERLEEVEEEKDKFKAWVRSAEEHTRYRTDLGLGSNRPLTSWLESGWKLLPDFHASTKIFTERVLDCLEIAHLRNVRRGFDDRYYSRMLELSQNCFRVTDITKTGIMPCLTPSGIPFWSCAGRRLTGRETLTLQGIPVHRIDLSFLTETQLRDLTGNAMSSTAVGVCIISALLNFTKYLEPGFGRKILHQKANLPNFEEKDLHFSETDPETTKTIISVSDVIKHAGMSAKLCWCEKSDEILSRKFKKCCICQHTICQLHAGNPKHDYKILTSCRSPPHKFERILNQALPKKISLSFVADRISIENFLPKDQYDFEIDQLQSIYFKSLKSDFWLTKIKRSDIWEIFYESSSARYILNISATSVEWLLYAKPPQHLSVENSTRQHLARYPIAQMTPHLKDITYGSWSFWVPARRTISARIEWAGELVPSFKNDIGLVDDHEVEIFSIWRVHVDHDSDLLDLSGDYHLQKNCGQAMNSLHVRKESATRPRLFLFLDHDKKTGDYKEHHYIFSLDARDLEYGIHRRVIARLPAYIGEPEVKKIPCGMSFKYMIYRMNPLENPNSPEHATLTSEPPSLSQVGVNLTVDGNWYKVPIRNLSSDADNRFQEKVTISYGHLLNPEALHSLNQGSCLQSKAVFTCKAKVPSHIPELFQKGVWNQVSTKNMRDVFHHLYGFLSDGLIIPFYIEEKEEWHKLTANQISRCSKCAPVPPPILWHLNEKQIPKPFENLAQACDYEKDLKNRPATMSQIFMIDDKNILTYKIGINFQSLIHRAASIFTTGNITSSWRFITDNHTMTRPPMPTFKIKDTTDMTPIQQWKNKKYPLRLEQRRSIAWQIRRELNAEIFVEQEIVEDGISHIGYQALAKASRESKVLGGLLAHEVGFGKTIIILALIGHQTDFDRSWGEKIDDEKIYSKATVIFVPSSLTTQWANEINKFLPHFTKILIIRNMKDLRGYNIEQIKDAEIIIVNSSILQNEGYLFDLSQISGMLVPDWDASSRAKKTWHDTAVSNIAKSIRILKDDSQDLTSYLNRKLNISWSEAQGTERPYPSRRYTGRQYIEKKLKTTKKGINNLESPNEAEPGKRKRKIGDEKKDRDAMLVENRYPKKGQKWTSTTHVVFEMFSFARIVIDEYHYLSAGQVISLAGIESNSRWLLSATPLLETFEQFKQIAQILGIYLGRDDFSTMAPEVFRARMSDMTTSERFLAFDKPSSPAWLKARYNQMQLFLDTFVRKDIAVLSDFDTEECVHLVHQPVAERAFYIELEQFLAANQFQMPRMRETNSESEYQIHLTLGKFKVAEQALLNGASFYSVQAYTAHQLDYEIMPETIDISLYNRTLDLDTIKKKIFRDMQRAEWLQANFSECSDIRNYKSFKHMVKNIGAKDSQATEILRNLLMKAETKMKEYNWKHDFFEPGKHIITDKISSNSKLPYPSGLIQDQGKKVSAPVRYLRTTTSSLDNSVKRMTKLVRALRYTTNVKAVFQMTNSKTSAICEKCLLAITNPKDSMILGSCGHIICKSCSLKASGNCTVTECGAAFQSHQQYSGEEFLIGHRSPDEEKFGTKVADMIRYLKKVPMEEKILIFVQEETAIEKIMLALAEARLAAVLLGGRNPASIIENFQKGNPIGDALGPKTERSILILNIGDSSAAGSNLTIANHVIFFAPYFTTGSSALQKFNHAMEQGIGRAVRYGQTRKVNIIHFLTSRTHDVDLFEHRKRCQVVISDASRPNRAKIVQRSYVDGAPNANELAKAEHSSLTWYMHEHL